MWVKLKHAQEHISQGVSGGEGVAVGFGCGCEVWVWGMDLGWVVGMRVGGCGCDGVGKGSNAYRCTSMSVGEGINKHSGKSQRGCQETHTHSFSLLRVWVKVQTRIGASGLLEGARKHKHSLAPIRHLNRTNWRYPVQITRAFWFCVKDNYRVLCAS